MSKEITMSFDQFFGMERGNISLEKILVDNGYENKVVKVISTERFQRTVVMTASYALIIFAPELAATVPVGGPISATALKSFVQKPIYILCGTTCTFEAIKALVDKNYKQLPTIAIKYGIVFGSVYSMDKFFSTVKHTSDYLVSSFSEIAKELSSESILSFINKGGCIKL